MKTIKNGQLHTIKLEKGDLVMKNLLDYVKEKNIGFAKITIFGVVTNVELGYMFAPGEYTWKTFNDGGYELLPSEGSIAWDEGEPQIYMHGSISDANFKVYGGHFKEMEIHGVGEVFITELSKDRMTKEFDPNAGLMLWKMK